MLHESNKENNSTNQKLQLELLIQVDSYIDQAYILIKLGLTTLIYLVLPAF